MKIQISDSFNYKKLIRFILPSIFMMTVTSIYGVIDGLFVSNFVGKTPFAAINLIMPFPMILGGMGFSGGVHNVFHVAKHISKLYCRGGKAQARAYSHYHSGLHQRRVRRRFHSLVQMGDSRRGGRNGSRSGPGRRYSARIFCKKKRQFVEIRKNQIRNKAGIKSVRKRLFRTFDQRRLVCCELNNGLVSAVLSFLRALVFQVAYVFLLPWLVGVDGIWWAMFATEASAFVVAVIFFIAFRKKYGYA